MTTRRLALGLALALVACGGRAQMDASTRGTTDASLSMSGGGGDAAAPPPVDFDPCPGMLSCVGCNGETYCSNNCATTCPATLADAGPPADANGPVDAGYGPSTDGGVCPAGMSLCHGCGLDLFCASTCPLPCPPATPVPECPGGGEQCICYGSIYCGSGCGSNCEPRPVDSGWCSEQFGAVWADEADATAATACTGECVQVLEIDASANGEIPVDYGCAAPTVPECDPSTCVWCSATYGAVDADQAEATGASQCTGKCTPTPEADAGTVYTCLPVIFNVTRRVRPAPRASE